MQTRTRYKAGRRQDVPRYHVVCSAQFTDGEEPDIALLFGMRRYNQKVLCVQKSQTADPSRHPSAPWQCLVWQAASGSQQTAFRGMLWV